MRGGQVLRQLGHTVRGLCCWALSAERRAGGVHGMQQRQILRPWRHSRGRVQGWGVLSDAVFAGGMRGGWSLLPAAANACSSTDRNAVSRRVVLCELHKFGRLPRWQLLPCG